MLRPELVGIHHVRIPVSDVSLSADWYTEAFGLPAVLMEEDEHWVIGAVLSMGEAQGIGLHLDPARSAALKGFCVLAIGVDVYKTLSRWDSWLDQLKLGHSSITEGPYGWYIDVVDPDGLILQLHTSEHPSVEET